MEEPHVRVHALTGLRMLAAASVCLSHISGVNPPPGMPTPLRSFLAAGYNGVTVFFILSGFVLAFNYGDRLGEHMTGRGLWSFAVARFARVYPLYLLVLLWILTPTWLAGKPTTHVWQHVLSVQTWSTDIVTAYQYNGPGWSIGVELFLYACFPLLLLALRPLRHNVPALLLVAALCVAASGALVAWFTLTGRAQLPWTDPSSAHRWLYRMPVTRLGDFVLGMTAAFLLALAPRNRSPWWGRAGQLAGGVTLVALMSWPQVLGTAQSWDVIYMAPAFFLIIGLALSPMTWLARVLSSRAMITLGEASFAFYLLHAPLLAQLHLGKSPTLAEWVFSTAAAMGIVTLAAVGLNVCVEKPARNLLRSLLDGKGPKDRRPAAPAPAPAEHAELLAPSKS
jgi:peptidoglycan/LPS O-acetylase OafA/YrhL